MSLQALERAISLIRILAAAGAEGRRLVDLQAESGLTKPTVHRILSVLRKEEFVDQVDETRRYRLGHELSVLGWSAGRNVYDLRELAFDDLCAVASLTGDTSFLMVRSAHDTVCIDRQTGAYPVKAFIVEVGMRRPIGVGASGVAMLAALQPEQEGVVFDAIRAQQPRYPLATEARIRQAVAAARRQGYALSDELMVKGVRAVAVCIHDPAGRPVAGISVAGIHERITDKRIPEIVRVMKTHASRIEQRIAAANERALHGSTRVVRTAGVRKRG